MATVQLDCDHEFEMDLPYDVDDMGGTFAHVTVRGCCTECGMVVYSDYSWDITNGEVHEEGSLEGIECDECGCELEEGEAFFVKGDVHLCDKECHDIYYEIEDDDEEEE